MKKCLMLVVVFAAACAAMGVPGPAAIAKVTETLAANKARCESLLPVGLYCFCDMKDGRSTCRHQDKLTLRESRGLSSLNALNALDVLAALDALKSAEAANAIVLLQGLDALHAFDTPSTVEAIATTIAAAKTRYSAAASREL